MKTDIEFLERLQEDLMEAAGREGVSRPAVRQPSRHVVKVAAALAAALVTLSGVVGYGATRSQGRQEAGNVVAGAGATYAPVHEGALPHKVLPGPQPMARPSPLAPNASSSPVPGTPPVGPSIIKTARLSLRVPKDTFKERFDQATRTAQTYDGYVQSSSTGGGRLRAGGLLIRVPAANFERALTDLRALGRVERQTVLGRDVSGQFVDLQARLRNARAEEQVLLKLLAKAPTVEASLRVQNTLSDVELRIEELQGQIRFLQHRAALSTIDVELSEHAPKHHHATHQTFAGAWRDAMDGFFGVLTAVVVGLGYVVPIAVLLAVAWLVLRRVRARVAA